MLCERHENRDHPSPDAAGLLSWGKQPPWPPTRPMTFRRSAPVIRGRRRAEGLPGKRPAGGTVFERARWKEDPGACAAVHQERAHCAHTVLFRQKQRICLNRLPASSPDIGLLAHRWTCSGWWIPVRLGSFVEEKKNIPADRLFCFRSPAVQAPFRSVRVATSG
jgi:hypothetical protein